MKKKEAKRLKKLVRHIFDDWYHNLGLGPYQRTLVFYDSRKAFEKATGAKKTNNGQPAMCVYTDWCYQFLEMNVCLPVLMGMTKGRIEGLVVHEFLHALVNPMATKKQINHEEFVVTNLTNAFIWVRNDAYRKGKSK